MTSLTAPPPPSVPAPPEPALRFVSGLVVAAGASARFGAPKLVAPLGGVPLLLRSVLAFTGAGLGEVLVVLGAHADLLLPLLADLPVRPVRNPRWEAGMFSSVRAGLAEVSPAATRVAVSPADLPFLTPEVVARVARASLEEGGSAVTLPVHEGRRGHPLLLPRPLAARVLGWPDDARLDRLLREPDVSVSEVGGCGPGVLRDVDTPGDLAASAKLGA
ncbi:nucleotidyltransferase family protein [Acidobacteria bacterium ACD]|nr:MAG: nucleotidyltransferase family protein [Acidobacteriota bacterium]MCE7958297.1 nucleotidyltransferase family protein [Acidobacteria bacterium ACB2]MDL1951161.1 nucleotidyltransferase family protein [Acidobacteria bacterium ACD]